MYTSTHQLQRESSFLEWKLLRRVSLLGCEVAGSTTQSYSTSQGLSPFPSSASLQMVSWYWLFFLVLCGVSVHVFVHVRVQPKNSNWTTMRMFSNFNLLHGCCTLLPFLPLLHNYALLTRQESRNKSMKIRFHHLSH